MRLEQSPPSSDENGRIFGRDPELRALEELVADVSSGSGGALLIRGNRGTGRSALLGEISRSAEDRFLVLRTAGNPVEREMPFAALHTLLRPIRSGISELPEFQVNALGPVLGAADPASGNTMGVGTSVLSLLSSLADRKPVLLLVDDCDLLDDRSSEVLAFVSRRLEGTKVGVIASTSRTVGAGRFEFPEMLIGPLEPRVARQVIEAAAPNADPVMRDRVLRLAEGNPLALRTLPALLNGSDGSGEEPRLSPELQAAFAPGIEELSDDVRLTLLVAALNDTDSLEEALQAGSALTGAPVRLADLEQAIDPGIVTIEDGRIHFRHRLSGLAVRNQSSLGEIESVHLTLTEIVVTEDRKAWHQAQSRSGSDEGLAGGLESAAGRAREAGDLIRAGDLLERAAALSEDRGNRNRRLLSSAELAHDLGLIDLAFEQLEEVRDPDEFAAGRLSRLRTRFDPLLVADLEDLRDGIRDAASLAVDGDDEEALYALVYAVRSAHLAAKVGWLEDEILDVLSQIRHDPSSPYAIFIRGLASPFTAGSEIREKIARIRESDPDPDTRLLLGYTALCVADPEQARELLAEAASAFRRQGRKTPLTQASALLSQAETDLGNYGEAESAAMEAIEVAQLTGQKMSSAIAASALALAAAIRGEEDAVFRQAASAERRALPLGGGVVLARIQFARAVNALGAGQPAEAFDHLKRIFDPDDPAFEQLVACRALGDLAEAATRSGQTEFARQMLEETAGIIEGSGSTRLMLSLDLARVVLDSETVIPQREPAGSWPFQRARLNLATGMQLRRRRQVAASREPLREALETFDRIGARPWSSKATQELMATSESAKRGPETRDELTPQELEVARLVATGLSNREIGQRLALSHRTVGSHLSRIFPKLDVTSRTEIASALEESGLT